jgi:hypothetical protein
MLVVLYCIVLYCIDLGHGGGRLSSRLLLRYLFICADGPMHTIKGHSHHSREVRVAYYSDLRRLKNFERAKNVTVSVATFCSVWKERFTPVFGVEMKAR